MDQSLLGRGGYTDGSQGGTGTLHSDRMWEEHLSTLDEWSSGEIGRGEIRLLPGLLQRTEGPWWKKLGRQAGQLGQHAGQQAQQMAATVCARVQAGLDRDNSDSGSAAPSATQTGRFRPEDLDKMEEQVRCNSIDCLCAFICCQNKVLNFGGSALSSRHRYASFTRYAGV